MKTKDGLYLGLIFLLILFSGCKEMSLTLGTSKTAKQLLFEHPEISLQLPSSLGIYDKYSSPNFIAEKDEILIINIADKKYEVLLTERYQQLGDTIYFVKACNRR